MCFHLENLDSAASWVCRDWRCIINNMASSIVSCLSVNGSVASSLLLIHCRYSFDVLVPNMKCTQLSSHQTFKWGRRTKTMPSSVYPDEVGKPMLVVSFHNMMLENYNRNPRSGEPWLFWYVQRNAHKNYLVIMEGWDLNVSAGKPRPIKLNLILEVRIWMESRLKILFETQLLTSWFMSTVQFNLGTVILNIHISLDNCTGYP